VITAWARATVGIRPIHADMTRILRVDRTRHLQ
jgi:hypothetical protein